MARQDATERHRILSGYRSSLREPWSRYDEGPMTHLGRGRVQPKMLLAAGDVTGR
jgi:hypothetical protein